MAFLSFETSVDLIPERAEVVDGRDNGEKDNDVESKLSEGVKKRNLLVAQNQKSDCGDLRNHLNLAEFGGTDSESLS